MSYASPQDTPKPNSGTPLPIAEAYMTGRREPAMETPASKVKSWLGSVRPGTSASMARFIRSASGNHYNEELHEEKTRAPLVPQGADRYGSSSRESVDNERNVYTKPRRRFRPSALLPFVMSLVSFILTLLLVLSGTSPGYYEELNLISFNTTNLGTGIVSFAPATATATTTAIGRRELPMAIPTISPTAAIVSSVTAPLCVMTQPPSLEEKPLSQPPSLEERQLSMPSPGDLLSSLSSVASSIGAGLTSSASRAGSDIGSMIASATIPGISLPTSTPNTSSSGPLEGLGSLLSEGIGGILSSIFGGIISGITTNIAATLNRLVAQMTERIRTKIGLQDYYSIHVLHACSGSSADDIKNCPTYGTVLSTLANSTSSIPTSFVVLGMNITSPMLAELMDGSSSVAAKADPAQKILLTLMVLSLLGSGLCAVFSLVAIFFPNNRFLVYANLGLMSAGFISRFIDAIASTLINIILGKLVNSMGNAMGLYATTGTMYLVLTWIAFVTATVSSIYWFVIWYVEFRKVSFEKRIRTEEQVGDWRLGSVKKELVDDVTGRKKRMRQSGMVA